MKNRLDKVLSSNGFGSRRDIKRILHTRTLTVNGVICRDASSPVDPDTDMLELDGMAVTLRSSVYLMLNKCSGVVTSTDDPGHTTVMDLLGPPWSKMQLFPIGRLDVDTEGLLVITNDGPLTHRLTSPKTGVDKTYFARLRDPVEKSLFTEYEKSFLCGIRFHDGYTCLPAKIERNKTTNEQNGENGALNEVLITIQEGKYHQVKKMFKVVGNEVIYLKRVSMGSLSLDPSLEAGCFRELTEKETALLKNQEYTDNVPDRTGGEESL